MGWEIGYDGNWKRDIGYGVPAYCDHPECNEEIDRGLGYICSHGRVFGGDGCGLFFCEKHRGPNDRCERCAQGKEPFDAKPDHPRWIEWKLTDESWQQWRDENPAEVEKLRS
jgi:hypothetical protein